MEVTTWVPTTLLIFWRNYSRNFNRGDYLDYNIPMTKMRGSKPLNNSTLLDSWSWAKPYYEFWINIDSSAVSKIIIDPKNEMADIDRINNSLRL